MITENEYRTARRIVAVCSAMLVLVMGLLVWVISRDADAHN